MAMLIIDTDCPRYTMLDVNDAYLNATNSSREQLIGQSVFMVFPANPGDDASKNIELTLFSFEQAISTKKTHTLSNYRYDIPIRGSDQFEERYWTTSNTPILDKNGDVIYFIHSPFNVTELYLLREREKAGIEKLREQQHKLEEAEQRGRMVVDAVGLGTFDLDITTGELTTSTIFANIFGFNEPVSRREYMKHFHPHDLELRARAHEEAIRNGKMFYEARVIWPDKSVHWVRVEGKVYYDEQSYPVRMLGTLLDITEPKHLQQQKDDFLAIASHELKTPVTSIKAYTQVLEKMLRKKGEDKEASMINKMDVQLNRLTSLIGDLLDVTKINAGKLQFNDQDFDFNAHVKELLEDLQRITEKHKLVEKLNPVGIVHADKERIGQVITNLITNAIKYSPQSGKIIIHTSLQDGEVVLCVQDFGIGIPEDKQTKVFEQFYRVAGDMQHTFPGLGLGLYISSEIIRREGGRIWVKSKPGEGSSFCFSLPVKDI